MYLLTSLLLRFEEVSKLSAEDPRNWDLLFSRLSEPVDEFCRNTICTVSCCALFDMLCVIYL